jgi:hypothetical protein
MGADPLDPIVVILPDGDPTRVEVRFATEALAALQAALMAAQQGSLGVAQARAAVDVLQRYIAVSDTHALRAGDDPAAQQKLDAADGEPTAGDIARAARSGKLRRHQAETAIHLLTRASLRMPAKRQQLDAADRLAPGCSCDVRGVCTHVDSHDPIKRIPTMTTKSADYERGKADAEAALARTRGVSEADIERHRQILRAQELRARAPLATTVPLAMSSESAFDAWDVEQLRDRPNESTVTPSGATSQPRPGDAGAKVAAGGAAAPGWTESFEASGVGLSKKSGFSSFAGNGMTRDVRSARGWFDGRTSGGFDDHGEAPTNFARAPHEDDHDPEAA